MDRYSTNMTHDGHDPIEPWIRKNARPLATTRIFTLEEQHWHCPSDASRSGDFAVIDSPDWVNVFAITPDREIVLVEQFRFGVGINSLETPGGIVDRDENPAVTAARELREETGFTGDEPVFIGALSANAAILNNRFHTYVIENAINDAQQNLDEHEQIRVVTKPLTEIPSLIGRGQIHHSVIVAAYALFEIWRAGND